VDSRAGPDMVVKRKIPSLRRESNPDHPAQHYITELSRLLDCKETYLKHLLKENRRVTSFAKITVDGKII
jgi:hypothetical protein